MDNGDGLLIHSPSTSDTSVPTIIVPLGTALSVVERELILSTLEHCHGERKRTAELLGICTKTLYNRLREYGVRDSHGSSRNWATTSSGSANAQSVETA
jgi:DNA-binding NtrC family response regulator